MLLLFFLTFFIHSEETEGDDDDFWNQLSDDDVVIDRHVEGKLYDKARFNLPVKRRMKLYPQISKTVKYLQGRQNMEFIYESRIPKLIFLDSDDVTVDTIDISKMSKDEIIALLALRGFKDIDDEPIKSNEPKIPNATNQTTTSNETTQTQPESSTQETQKTNETTKEL